MTLRGALRDWEAQLEAWAIPDDILRRAPEPPWSLDPAHFRSRLEDARRAHTPSRRAALDALEQGGSVLDVGAGAGAASLPLVPPAGSVVAVDVSGDMLHAFALEAEAVGAAHREIEGRWPDVAAEAPRCDVVVCHHVVYNVPDLAPFLVALTAAARRRVVIELTVTHPMVTLGPLWRRFHGIDRPHGPAVEDLLRIADHLGLDYRAEVWCASGEPLPRPDVIRTVRKRLCLPPERDPDIDAALPQGFSLLGGFLAGSARIATVWWPGGSRRP